MHLTENQPLAPFTTFGIGGPARWFARAHSEDDVAEACEWARALNVPLFVLGGGSNVLVSDDGFPGLVLHVEMMGIAQEGDVFRVAAGEPWDHCVQQTIESGWAGLECLAGIPGTAGGTPVQNVGAYGQDVASVIDRVRVFDVGARTYEEIPAEACEFGYRRSRFNTTDRGWYIVTRVDYRLRRNGMPHIFYPDLKKQFEDYAGTPSLPEVANAVRAIRHSKGMLLVEGDPDCRSAGSFFKNPQMPRAAADWIKRFAAERGAPLRTYRGERGFVKVPAAWLIEQAGFAKGYTLGCAGISSKHTLALVNIGNSRGRPGDARGGATAAEILALANEIREAVEKKFRVRLEREPELVGFG
jgi:UDP-N-acetylmuramate dehydrogenase